MRFQLRNLVFALWKRGAYLGDPWCTFGVANAYEEGIGVEKGTWQFAIFQIHVEFDIIDVLFVFFKFAMFSHRAIISL